MPNNELLEKDKMIKTLYRIFTIVFSTSAFLGIVCIILIILSTILEPDTINVNDTFTSITWVLWGTIISQIAAAIFVLWRNLLDLSPKESHDNYKNIIIDIIDGLESNGNISNELARNLLDQYIEENGDSISSPILPYNP